MPIAQTGPRPRLEFSSLTSRQSRPMTTVQAEAKIARGRAAPGPDHRVDPAVVVVQLLAISADQQQGIVRAGADDQDRQDALALAVERDDVVLGQQRR